jgi:hypothetical protein
MDAAGKFGFQNSALRQFLIYQFANKKGRKYPELLGLA